jgi:hypothetical protein
MHNVGHLELTTFPEIFHAIKENNDFPVRIQNNTYAQFTEDSIQISLHGSPIVLLTADRISVSLCGYNTPTTRRRIAEYLPKGATIACKKGDCFITLENGERVQVPTSEGTNPSNGYVHILHAWNFSTTAETV